VSYQFRTKPYTHQLVGFDLSKDKPYYALWMEQRTGKSKLTIDTAAYNYHQDRIDCLIVVAPNGVHTNWALDEIPVHLPEEIKHQIFLWRSSQSNSIIFRKRQEALIKFQGLSILCINVEATITKAGKEYLTRLLKKRRCLMVIDESTDIKTPGSQRTKSIRALGRLARMRRILTGTPGKPMDQFSQINFLSPHILDTASFTAFKAEYGVWTRKRIADGRSYPVLEGYRNLDKLRKLLEPYVYRVTQQQAFPNMPERVYTKHYIELSKQQSRMYHELREEYLTLFDDGEVVSAPMTLVRLLRLQQISSGYVPTEEGILRQAYSAEEDDTGKVQPERIIPGPNPRIEALKYILERSEGKAIIWARFKLDIYLISELIQSMGQECLMYTGAQSHRDKLVAKEEFQRGKVPYLVANQRAAGRGLDFSAADNVIYYSNYFGLETRRQSEDRAQSGKRTTSVLYTDIVAEDTIDEKIIRALRSDQSLADLITGDPKRAWI